MPTTPDYLIAPKASFDATADAIRAKTGSQASITWGQDGFASAIGDLAPKTIASGTFVGNNNTADVGRQQFSIGTKMPLTDFYVLVKSPSGTEFEKTTSQRPFVWLYVECRSSMGSIDMSLTGNIMFAPNSNYYVNSNDSGTLTQRNCWDLIKAGKQIYNGNLDNANVTHFKIIRQTDHFDIYMGISNSVYIFPSSVTYSWEIVYFGHNPSTDIVEIT